MYIVCVCASASASVCMCVVSFVDVHIGKYIAVLYE